MRGTPAADYRQFEEPGWLPRGLLLAVRSVHPAIRLAVGPVRAVGTCRGICHHDGNPITAWEAGHIQAKEDYNGNMRPVKPLRQDQKKIDGIVATIMGLDAATRLAANISVYETRGVRSV